MDQKVVLLQHVISLKIKKNIVHQSSLIAISKLAMVDV